MRDLIPLQSNFRENLGMPDDKDRSGGMHLVSMRGGGKSRFLGRYLAPMDFLRGVPTVVFDNGDTIDNFLDKLSLMDERIQDAVWPHVKYVNMAGQNGRVVPFPIYYRLGKEPNRTVVQRFVDAVRRLHPELESAGVMGFPPLARLARAAGLLLLATDKTILDMASMITQPDLYKDDIARAAEGNRALSNAAFNLREVRYIDTLLDNLSMFDSDEAIMAIYGARQSGIDWKEVIDNRQIVLLDFRDIDDVELRRFSIIWSFWTFISYIRFRGPTLTSPVSVIFDEFAALTNVQSEKGQEQFGKDLDLLLNTIMRRHSLWLTLAHQEMGQFSDKVQNMLLGMATQVLGAVSDQDEALGLARQFFRFDPYKVKRTRVVSRPDYEVDEEGRVQGVYQRTVHGGRFTELSISSHLTMHVEEEAEYFTIPEQHYDGSYRIRSLPPFYFYVKHPRTTEGKLVSIGDLEKDTYPDKRFTEAVRIMLMERDGIPIKDLLPEDLKSPVRDTQKKAKPQPPVQSTQGNEQKAKVRIVGKKLND